MAVEPLEPFMGKSDIHDYMTEQEQRQASLIFHRRLAAESKKEYPV